MELCPDRSPTLASASAVRPLFAAPVPYPLLASLGAQVPSQNTIATANSAIWYSQCCLDWGCAFSLSTGEADLWLKKVWFCLETEAVCTGSDVSVNVPAFSFTIII